MKKVALLLSVFVIFAMIVAACQPEETEPGVGTPVVPDTGVTPDPAVPEQTPEPAVPAETPMVTPEVTPEETPEVTPEETPVATPEETPEAAVLDDDHPSRASYLLDLNVRNMQDETLGDVDDMVISVDGEEITHVIVGRGGFLGIGEDHVAVPFQAMTLEIDENENWFFLLDIDEETWEQAPTIDRDEVDFRTPGWEAEHEGYWAQYGAPGQQQQEEGDDAAPAPGQQPAQPGLAMAPHSVLLTHLLGTDVHTLEMVDDQRQQQDAPQATPEPGTPAATPAPGQTPAAGTDDDIRDRAEDIADIEELIVDYQTGEVLYVVLEADLDNWLRDRDVTPGAPAATPAAGQQTGQPGVVEGTRWYPVPLMALDIQIIEDEGLFGDDYELFITIEASRLVNAPSFDVGELPHPEQDPQWDAGVRQHWDVQ
jgi:sporulation protein YlmC with PRC-barrel domain/predicted small secreted protein